MKIVSTCIIAVATFAGSVLMPKVASAYQYVGVDHTYSFNGLVSGSCDSNFSTCTIPEWTSWFTGGRAGYNIDSGNTYLWVANDDSWNSWNTWFNPTIYEGGSETEGECSLDLAVDAAGTATVGYVDLWYDSGATQTFLGGADLTGTNSSWETEYTSAISISAYYQDWRHGGGILAVLGRYPGQSGSEFIAMDDVHIYCTHN